MFSSPEMELSEIIVLPSVINYLMFHDISKLITNISYFELLL